jgi:hypothetical protein
MKVPSENEGIEEESAEKDRGELACQEGQN